MTATSPAGRRPGAVDLEVISAAPAGPTRPHPLLFVHGAWHAAWCWQDHFMPWFAARGWECHAVSLRGHGGSPNPSSLRRTRIRHYAGDLTEVIDSLPVPPIVVAHSMGALVAQRALEGRRLPGLVLVAPVPLGGVWRTTLRVIRRHPWKFLKANLTLNLWPIVEDRTVAARLLLEPDTPVEVVDAVWRRLQPESYLAYLDMLLFVRARPALVPTPVRLVAAGEDRLFAVGDARRTAQAYGVEPVVVEGAAHDMMLGSSWEAAAAAVEGALESL